MYPIDKYQFFFDETNKKVIAISTYAGRRVKGIAKTDPRDEFNKEKGKQLAAARCNAKIAKKRAKRAKSKLIFAQRQLEEARDYYDRMTLYYKDAHNELVKAVDEVATMVETF